MSSPADGIVAEVSRVAESAGKLAIAHIQLARLEIVEDARKIGSNLARVAVFAVFVFAGYLTLCAAAASILATWMPMPAALSAVAGFNIALGAIGAWRAVQRMSAAPAGESRDQLAQSLSVLSEVRR
jgi:hypothetical protein